LKKHTRNVSLLKFRNPPVVEVACGVSFNSIQGLDIQSVILLRDEFKKRFPTVEQHEILPVVIEEENTLRIDSSGIPRMWFISNDNTRIIQLQGNRFLLNWRRFPRTSNDPYPRFPGVYGDFSQLYTQFQQFVRRRGLGSVEPVQYEMTYVNYVESVIGADSAPALPDFAWRVGDQRYLPPPLAFDWQTSFLVPDVPGRMHVRIRPPADGEADAAVLEITVRGRGGASKQSQDRWFNGAHEVAVLGFQDLTSEAIRQKWGQE